MDETRECRHAIKMEANQKISQTDMVRKRHYKEEIEAINACIGEIIKRDYGMPYTLSSNLHAMEVEIVILINALAGRTYLREEHDMACDLLETMSKWSQEFLAKQ